MHIVVVSQSLANWLADICPAGFPSNTSNAVKVSRMGNLFIRALLVQPSNLFDRAVDRACVKVEEQDGLGVVFCLTASRATSR